MRLGFGEERDIGGKREKVMLLRCKLKRKN